MKYFLLSLFAFPLLASVNEPLRIQVFTGYRNDRIHWHNQTESQLYRDVQYWENGIGFKVIHRDLTFFLRGAYGTFGKGTLDQNSEQSDTSGWTADGVGYFGYAINLTADRSYKVLLTPLIGYSGSFEQLTSMFRQVWNGVLLGGNFTIEPIAPLIFNAGYSFHFLHNRMRAQTVEMNSSGNKGHTGWAQMDWIVTYLWRLGLGGQLHYFSSRGNYSKHFKLRWTSVSGWAQISREF